MKRFFAVFCILMLFTTTLISDVSAVSENVTVVRLAGNSRVATAIEICNERWGSIQAKSVVLASAYSYADALAGAPLAAALDAPILLTSNVLEEGVKEKLKQLGTQTVYLLGGELAICTETEEELVSLGYEVKRLAGQNRAETAVQIAYELENVTQSKPSQLFVVYGYNYPDALSVSAVSGILSAPILFSGNTEIYSEATCQYITETNCNDITIIGGTLAVEPSVEQQIATISNATISRVFGSDRYETSVAICKEYDHLFQSEDIALATGANYPDALAGGAFAAGMSIPVLLISDTYIPQNTYDYVAEKDSQKVYVFGGTLALSDHTIDCLLAGEPLVKVIPNHISRTITISVSSAFTYTDASTSTATVDKVYRGEKYDVIDEKNALTGTYTWFKIKTDKGEGWIVRTKVTTANSYVEIEEKTFDEKNKPIIYLSPSKQKDNLFYCRTTSEKKEMEAIAAIIKETLDEQYDCITYMATPDLNINERDAEAFSLDADIYVAIHSNATGTGAVKFGASAYYFTACEQSKLMAENIVNELNAIAPRAPTSLPQIHDGMLLTGNLGYGEVREPSDLGMIAVLAETDFHDNSVTGSWIKKNHDAIAQAYVNALVKTFDIKHTN